MQPKVSMVMTCYNKADDIGEMLDSVLAQEWDNIELVLVNDGSTDGTREIITEYKPKLETLGYEVIIIDQDNAGVCAAAKAGFEQVTGEFLCCIDADDELDPRYVSVLAGWLHEHDEYDIAACEGLNYVGRGAYKRYNDFCPFEIIDGDPYIVEHWMLCDFRNEPWRYMVRAEYFRKCRIVETYYTQTKGSHEPAYVIPLLAYGGKLKYFQDPLYHWQLNDLSHSQHKHMWQVKKHFAEYVKLSKIAIEALPNDIASAARKQNMVNTIALFSAFRLFYYAHDFVAGTMYTPSNKAILSFLGQHNVLRVSGEFLNTANSILSIEPPIKYERVAGQEVLFFEMVKNCLVTPLIRIVGCGALGKRASSFLPKLKGTPLEPTELWDAAGDGTAAKKPDYSKLCSNDIAIIFPLTHSETAKDICGELEKTGCAIITADELKIYINRYLTFPELVKIGRAKLRS